MDTLEIRDRFPEEDIFEPPRLGAHDYKRALQIQDACNLSGVVIAFRRVLSKLWEEADRCPGRGTSWVNTHPISVLYSSKIASLTGSEHWDSFHEAYQKCQELSGEAL